MIFLLLSARGFDFRMSFRICIVLPFGNGTADIVHHSESEPDELFQLYIIRDDHLSYSIANSTSGIIPPLLR